MTTIRTDIIPNLYANPIATISKASTAVITTPVVSKVVSTTGTIGTVTGSGTASAPWTATLSNLTTADGTFVTGQVLTATAGTGTFAAGGTVTISSVVGTGVVTIRKVGGTIPTAGTVTNVTFPAVSTLPIGFFDGVSGDQILFTNPGNTLTFTATTGTFVVNETITQATSGATGVVTAVFPTTIQYTATGSTAFDTTHVVTGSQSGATTTPTVVTGMNQLLTAGVGGTNLYYVNVTAPSTIALYTDAGLTVPVNSTSFTTATPGAGQYTTFDTVLITTP
jgi:hypothetical protein